MGTSVLTSGLMTQVDLPTLVEDDQLRLQDDVGHDVPEHDAALGGAERLHGLDVHVLLHRQRRRPHDAGRARDDRNANSRSPRSGRPGPRIEAMARARMSCGKGEQDVHQALDEQVDLAAEVGADARPGDRRAYSPRTTP